jgi:hypothetical protein
MLFIIVMDVLNSLFVKASEVGLLQPLSNWTAGQRLSLYADDVALFIKPLEDELNATMAILNAFGQASGLQTNLNRSCIIPIQCAEDSVEEISNMMPCRMAEFPCTYLGLPISNKKAPQRWFDVFEKIADKLPGWKAALMNKAGRATLVRFVLSAMPIYLLIAINVPKWFLRLVNKIKRGLFAKVEKMLMVAAI